MKVSCGPSCRMDKGTGMGTRNGTILSNLATTILSYIRPRPGINIPIFISEKPTSTPQLKLGKSESRRLLNLPHTLHQYSSAVTGERKSDSYGSLLPLTPPPLHPALLSWNQVKVKHLRQTIPHSPPHPSPSTPQLKLERNSYGNLVSHLHPTLLALFNWNFNFSHCPH